MSYTFAYTSSYMFVCFCRYLQGLPVFIGSWIVVCGCTHRLYLSVRSHLYWLCTLYTSHRVCSVSNRLLVVLRRLVSIYLSWNNCLNLALYALGALPTSAWYPTTCFMRFMHLVHLARPMSSLLFWHMTHRSCFTCSTSRYVWLSMFYTLKPQEHIRIHNMVSIAGGNIQYATNILLSLAISLVPLPVRLVVFTVWHGESRSAINSFKILHSGQEVHELNSKEQALKVTSIGS